MRGGDVYGYELRLSDDDETALVAFPKTFTDHEIVTDPELASPFE